MSYKQIVPSFLPPVLCSRFSSVICMWWYIYVIPNPPIYILFHILFHYRLLNIVPWALQLDLIYLQKQSSFEVEISREASAIPFCTKFLPKMSTQLGDLLSQSVCVRVCVCFLLPIWCLFPSSPVVEISHFPYMSFPNGNRTKKTGQKKSGNFPEAHLMYKYKQEKRCLGRPELLG